MGYVFRLTDAERHEDWLSSPLGQSVLELEKDLLKKVWAPTSPQRVLEVGCGSGVFLEWFHAQGHMPAGLEPSGSSLELARRRLRGRIRLDQGFGENLPYTDNEFDTVALINTLEYVDDPVLALKEAFRVARRNVLLGVLNRYSLERVYNFLEGFWKDSLNERARFFSVFQLQRMTGRILSGAVPIDWRTCFSLPIPLFRYLHFLERKRFLHHHPFGHFIAMRIDMRCRFRTIQTPVFSELPAGVVNASVRSLCWRSAPRSSLENRP
ncbi:MAG: class I SAM-dependent methyltransferase [Syntrophobacteraceae bacterium]